MHACGHDGHMAMVLALAGETERRRETLPRNVLLVFQPAEETTGGAKRICYTGIFERYNAVSYTHLRYRYAPAHKKELQNHSARLKAIFRESLTSCVCAQNIIVIKTLPGLASAACSAIDGMGISTVAGTLGGDDTGFICMFTNEDALQLCEEIKSMMK